jgi:hypothetical protein
MTLGAQLGSRHFHGCLGGLQLRNKSRQLGCKIARHFQFSAQLAADYRLDVRYELSEADKMHHQADCRIHELQGNNGSKNLSHYYPRMVVERNAAKRTDHR